MDRLYHWRRNSENKQDLVKILSYTIQNNYTYPLSNREIAFLAYLSFTNKN